MRLRRGSARLAMAGIMVLTMMSACTGGFPAAPDDAGPTTGHGPIDACRLLTKADLAGALGLPVDLVQKPEPAPVADDENPARGSRSCTIAASYGLPAEHAGKGGFVMVDARWFPDAAESSAAFDQEKTARRGVEAVPGIGESAFAVAGYLYVLQSYAVLTVSLGSDNDLPGGERLHALGRAATSRL